jgi:hypothetical protein
VKFAQSHNLEITAIIRRLNTKPFIRVEAGAFIGYLESQHYWLGSIAGGIIPAVRKMVAFCSKDRLKMEAAS